MKLMLDSNLGVFLVLFEHHEVYKATTYLEVTLEEAKNNNNILLEPKQYLFKSLHACEKHPNILFGHKDFNLGIRFLEFQLLALSIEGSETNNIALCLDKLRNYMKSNPLQ